MSAESELDKKNNVKNTFFYFVYFHKSEKNESQRNDLRIEATCSANREVASLLKACLFCVKHQEIVVVVRSCQDTTQTQSPATQ